MKFVPKIIDEEVNISKGSEWWYGLRVFLNVVLIGFAVYFFLGIIVDFVVPHIPLSWEEKLGAGIVYAATSDENITEKYNTNQLQRLLSQLAGLAPGVEGRSFSVKVVKDTQANALALPGGHIVIYSSLLDKVESENELAMILAHELGHFAARDHLRGLGRSFLFYIVTASLMGVNNNTSRIFMNSSGILTNTYSRTQEFAADKYAIELLNKFYGHAGGATDFFERLAKEETLPQLTQYLSTHPASYVRTKQLNDLISKNSYQVKETAPVFWQVEKEAE